MADPTVSLSPQPGMVALRGDLADATLRDAVGRLAGGVPDRLAIQGGLARGAAWMAPDELLILLPRDEVGLALAQLSEALAGSHHLVADVSDLRVALTVGGSWRETLAKLTPADLHPDAFGPASFRRSRLGQIAAAFWAEGQGAQVLCFRSVAEDLLALLRQSAADGPVGHFRGR